MENISVFKGFIKDVGTRTLPEILSGIRGAHYKEVVYRIRKAVEAREKEEEKMKEMKETKETKEKEVNKEVERLNKEVDRLKKSLLGFTVSGEFSGGRRMEFLRKYNPFIILDIDKLDPAVLPDLLKKINEISFTRISFISPRGRGVKIIVKVDSEVERHWLAYNEVADFYESELGVEIDRSGKDVTRLCFMSHDPSAYFDPNSAIFKVVDSEVLEQVELFEIENGESGEMPGEASFEGGNITSGFEEAFEKCIVLTNEKSEFKNGNRNNYIYQLAVNCHHAGIPQEVVNELSKVKFDFSKKEMEQTIKSAYNWKPNQLKSKAKMKSKNKKFVELEEETPSSMSLEMFSKLPKLLRTGCMAFQEERERDVFLTGALGVLSGCLPNVSGDYDGYRIYPNLYVFVIAPAASGKGALKFAKILGMGYHKQLLEESRKAYEKYKKELLEFDLASVQYKKGKRSEPPIEPEEVYGKTLFIPANSSSAMLIRHLQHNKETGVLFESEADTLGNVLKQDWGGFSDLMRKAYHHEPISYSRKNNNEYVEIEEPKLSVALSGTPGQVTGLIPSAEDGLFSRFLFYAFEVDATWRDVSPKGRPMNFQSGFEELSNDVVGMVAFLKKNPMQFTLTEKQWEVLNLFFKDLVEEMVSLVSKGTLSVVRRSGLMLFRIAMILSAIRKYEEQDVSERVICRDDDFESALSMVKVYFRHSFFLFDRLPKRVNNSFQFKNVKKQLFFDALPDRFPRKEAIIICGQFNMVARTADRYLKELLKSGYLGKSADGDFGAYFKIDK